MKGFSTLSKHIFIYIAICVISFILVSTICYKADYKHIYNYYSDRLYLQANEIANEYALDFLAESAHADACAPGNPKDASVEDLKDLFRKIM